MITKSEPDEHGHWGKFGGRFVPETLVAPLDELTTEFMRARGDPDFRRELNLLLRDYAGRPTPLFHARRAFYPATNVDRVGRHRRDRSTNILRV